MSVAGAIGHKVRRVSLRARWAVQLRGQEYHRDIKVHWSVRFAGQGVKLGTFVRIRQDGRIEGPCTIGDGTFINAGVWITPNTHIGPRCSIGPFARFITDHHEFGGPEHRAGDSVCRPVTVGAGCWLGAGVTVLPGVTIGDGAVVAAGSLVTRDVAPHTLVMGSPARFVRSLDEYVARVDA